VYAGLKSTATQETLVNKKPASEVAIPEIQQLTSEVNELKKLLKRVLQSNKDRKARQGDKVVVVDSGGHHQHILSRSIIFPLI
jgi:hypothetical protein